MASTIQPLITAPFQFDTDLRDGTSVAPSPDSRMACTSTATGELAPGTCQKQCNDRGKAYGHMICNAPDTSGTPDWNTTSNCITNEFACFCNDRKSTLLTGRVAGWGDDNPSVCTVAPQWEGVDRFAMPYSETENLAGWGGIRSAGITYSTVPIGQAEPYFDTFGPTYRRGDFARGQMKERLSGIFDGSRIPTILDNPEVPSGAIHDAIAQKMAARRNN